MYIIEIITHTGKEMIFCNKTKEDVANYKHAGKVCGWKVIVVEQQTSFPYFCFSCMDVTDEPVCGNCGNNTRWLTCSGCDEYKNCQYKDDPFSTEGDCLAYK